VSFPAGIAADKRPDRNVVVSTSLSLVKKRASLARS
jgi:hypothetical protein